MKVIADSVYKNLLNILRIRGIPVKSKDDENTTFDINKSDYDKCSILLYKMGFGLKARQAANNTSLFYRNNIRVKLGSWVTGEDNTDIQVRVSEGGSRAADSVREQLKQSFTG